MAKLLIIDIETAPVMGKVWELWQQNLSLDQIEEDWFIMSYAAKWYGQDETIYEDCRETIGDDFDLLQSIHALLDEADFVIAHNGARFDIPKINARFLINKFLPPSPYKVIDTLLAAKRTFKMTSNKLEWLTKNLCKTKKLDHGKFPGWKLWNECLRGNEEAWNEMRDYNIVDVLSLEELYEVLRPWMPNHPNINIYNDHVESCGCPKCGSTNLHRRGFVYTNKSKLQRYHCNSCGGWSSSTYTTNTIDERRNLLASR